MILRRLFGWIFHLLYHQFAWTYDWVAALVSGGHWTEWVRSTRQHLDGCERILEIGHGPGHLMAALLPDVPILIGVDRSPQMSRRARRRLLAASPFPALVLADARALPFPDHIFDAVVATFPAEYIAEPETWISFRRMIGADGKIVVLMGARPGGLHPLNLLGNLLFAFTSRIGDTEALRARARFLEEFEKIGLEWTHIRARVGSGQTHTIIAVPKADTAGPTSQAV